MSSRTISATVITNKIFIIRGQKVMVDRDLAELYGVTTKRLNEQVKRNAKRFPADFMFRLNVREKEQLVAICDRFKTMKHSTINPKVFTEQGVAMLSTVLNSERAIQVNIAIMRVFVQFRSMLSTHKELALKLKRLENKVGNNSQEIQVIFEAIRKLIATPEKPKKRIGFHGD